MAGRSSNPPSASTDQAPSLCTYHVFLSFRGADTRKSFTDFLYEELQRAGFHTFRDDNDIRRGKRIELEIRRGIEESKLFIIVLSKGYASSEWCLDELVMIMEREGIDGHVVLPIFYDVDPDQVLDQTHYYAEAFALHQEKFEEDRVEGWRKALRDVANLAGMVLGESHQARFVQEVVKTVRKELDSIMLLVPRDKGEQFAELVVELPCDATIGTEAKFNEIWSCLEEKDVGIIGLYGIGGVGKTTLLTQIYNKVVDVCSNLIVIWVVVGKDSNFEKIQADIGREIGVLHGSTYEKKVHIYNKLRMKKFILLLDDIWERIKLSEIGIPHREKLNGSKIIFTTRSLKLCGEMFAQKKIRIETLEWEHAWELFKKYVGEDIDIDDCKIRQHAETIAKKCGGLPIALITTGCAMSSKKEPREWHHAVEILKKPNFPQQNSEVDILNDLEVEVFSLLKFSFDNLPNKKVKSYFLYCALFPDDYLIPKGRLIENWVCEDMWIDDHEMKAYSEGYAIIGRLIRSCLLEEEGEFVRLHDVIRDMALWIERENTLVMAKMELTEAPPTEKWQGLRKLSMMKNKIEKLTQVPTCPELVTLLLNFNKELCEINEDFFQFMGKLTLLDLSWTSINKLPRSMINLVSIQFLDISFTKIEELPVELATFDKLKYLGLSGLRLKFKKSKKIISCLSSLQVIQMSPCEYSYEEEETNQAKMSEKCLQVKRGVHGHHQEKETDQTEEDASVRKITVDDEMLLDELQSLKQLSSLAITIRCLSSLKRLLSNQKFMSITRNIYLMGLKGIRLLNVCLLASMKYLVAFGVINCDFEEIYVESAANESSQWNNINFNCLEYVSLNKCSHLRDLTWLVLAPKLTYLTVHSCNKLEDVINGWKLADVVDGRWCQNLKPFSKLNIMDLRDLPQLTCIYPHPLPFLLLSWLQVYNCPLLKKLPLDSNSKEGSKIRLHGEEKWWEALEWEDDALFPRFRFRLW